ncbi:MAG: DUF1624 domain-containing protein [Acidimicrobiia bacterium]|nr:DUF1624 domain-containing protein [Acidimicrobiia bacterium]
MGSRAAPTRLAGVDLARAIAMLGMLIVHTLVTPRSAGDRALIWVNVWVAPLFVLVAGVGLSLGWQHRRTTRTGALVVVRAAALLVIGLLLATQFYGAILQYFALYFVLGVVALRLGRRALVALAGACLVIGPLVITFLVHTGSITLGGHADKGLGALAHPVDLLRALSVDGVYPAVVWSGFFFAGMALGRLDLDDPRLAHRLACGGALVGATGSFVGWAGARAFGTRPLGWTHHWSGAAHSESLTWAVTAAGIAIAILGVCLSFVRGSRGRSAWLAPPIAIGQLALTFYLVHLWYADTLWTDIQPHVGSTPAYVLSTCAFFLLFGGAAWLWRRTFRRGPVEGLVDGAARALVRPEPLETRSLRSVPV